MPTGRDISHNEITISNGLSDKMIINSNILATMMLNWIDSHVGGTNIITVEMNRIANDNSQIEQQLPYPNSLSSNVSKSMILSLNGRLRDCGLLFGKPGSKVGTKIDSIPYGGMTGVLTASQSTPK